MVEITNFYCMSFETWIDNSGAKTRFEEMHGPDSETKKLPADGEDVGNDLDKLTKVGDEDARRKGQENFNKNRVEGEKRFVDAIKKDPEWEAAYRNPESAATEVAKLEGSFDQVA